MNLAMAPSMCLDDCFDSLCGVRCGDLRMILGIGLGSSGLQILRAHGNHDRLLFLRIEQLNNAVMNEIGPSIALLLRDLHDVFLLNQELAIIDYEERSAHPPRVGIDPQLLLTDISHD